MIMEFHEWLEANRKQLIDLYDSNYEETLFQAFMAGMDYGSATMSKFAREIVRDVFIKG